MLKVLLCGIGKMGANHLRILNGLPGCELVALVDAAPGKAASVAKTVANCRGFDNLEDALRSVSADAAIIATPTASHFECSVQVLKARIPLLVEKPIAQNALEGRQLRALARELGIPLMIGHIERFNPAAVAIRKIVGSGAIGDIVSFNTKRLGGFPGDPKGATDVLVDLAVHDVDLAHWILGERIQVAGCVLHKGSAIDCANILGKTSNAGVSLSVNWLTPVKVREVTVTGSAGYLSANLITQEVLLTSKNPVLMKETGEDFGYEDYLRSFSCPDVVKVGISNREPLKEELAAFLRAVEHSTPMPVTAEDGLSALEVVEIARSLGSKPGVSHAA